MRFHRIDLTFTALLLPLDALAFFAAGIGGYLLRYSRFVTEVRPILQDVPLTQYFQTTSLFVCVWMILFALAGLYSQQPRKAWGEMGRIALACTAGTMILIATVFFRREITTSRFIVVAVWGLSIVFVTTARLCLRAIRHLLLQAHIGHKNVLVIGTSKIANGIVNQYRINPILGYTVVKQLNDWNEQTKKTIEKLREKQPIDVILLAEPELPREKALEVIRYTEEEHITFHYLADLFAATFSNIEISTGTGIPIVEVKRTPLDGWGRIAKRAFDIVVSLVLLLITSPIILIALAVLALEDGFPVIFQNVRVGESGNSFKLYKLRSMYRKFSIGPQFNGNEEQNLALEQQLIEQKSIKDGPVYKIANDPRITPFGYFIRRWSIDELPQLWNVLRGDMSLVGPRPHQPREVKKYLSHHRRVLAIRPGLTGLAQISGRSDLEFEDEVRLDTWYIENWSLLLDLYIVMKTPFAVLYRKGVY